MKIHTNRIKKLDENGSHIVAAILIIAVLAVVGFAGWQVIRNNKNKNDTSTTDTQLPDESKAGSGQITGWQRECKGTGLVELTHSPMDLKDVSSILPTGLLAGAHVTPIDHLYFYPKDMKNRDAAPVYAMADGYIVNYEERSQNVDNGTAKQAEYQLYFQHNCSVLTYFDLITSLEPSIASAIKNNKQDMHIPVKAGQIIGYVGAQSLDTAVYNLDMTLPGFINAASYATEPVKLHTDDFFSYFKDPIKSDMLALNPRKVEPYGGKIDYDIDGKLVGTWFLEGTVGYAGADSSQGHSGNSDGSGGYWTGHFSIAPDAITPSQINISFGNYENKPQQFTAIEGSQDPATVSKSTGLVAYEFYEYHQPNLDGGQQSSQQQVVGTVLFQLVEDRKLKIEYFPSKTKSEVQSFTGQEKTYLR